jgi:hypothetical protein
MIGGVFLKTTQVSMKNIGFASVTALLLLGCHGEAAQGDSAEKTGASSFTATMAEQQYNVAVTCSYFDQDYFQFLSDKTDMTDSNGDGLIISGMQNGKKLVLTINDHGTSYSTGGLRDFTKKDSIATGSGILYAEGSSNTVNVQFTVVCE